MIWKSRIIFFLIIFFIICSNLNERYDTVVAIESSFSDETVEQKELESHIKSIIDWKKTEQKQSADNLLTKEFLESAGETSADWYVLGLGRAGLEDDYAAYLAVIKDVVENKYKKEEKLSDSKATEWHRISLTILSAGGDPTDVGEDENNDAIDLIADGTYNRGKTTRPLGTQGINGWIWGLITLDSLRYELPDDAEETRNSIIEEILRGQLEDGGFSLNMYETESNVDLTAMAIQALAPYYNSEERYTYTQVARDEEVTKKVRDVVDESLDFLSEEQLEDGHYDLTEISNVESTAQVIVALTALGIDPLKDKRFIKNGNTLLDAVLTYQMPDGGFIHSDTLDEENKHADPNESNSMATEQVLYTFISLYRFYDGKRTLYDFREEMTDEVEEQVLTATDAIDLLPDDVKTSNKIEIEKAFKLYEDVPITERSYVYNYNDLANAMEIVELDNTSEFLAEHMGENKDGNGNQIALFEQDEQRNVDEAFTKEDEEKVNELLQKDISTEFYVDVVTYIDKLHHKETEETYEEILPKLEELKADIEELDEEIDQFNETILNELYPFNDITTDDQQIVEEVMQRYESLPNYDQTKIQGYDDVEKASIQINNLSRSKYITAGVIIVIVGMTVLLVIRFKKRKHEKNKQKIMN